MNRVTLIFETEGAAVVLDALRELGTTIRAETFEYPEDPYYIGINYQGSMDMDDMEDWLYDNNHKWELMQGAVAFVEGESA